jgi:DNA-binding CsgD family transcriptional regulator
MGTMPPALKVVSGLTFDALLIVDDERRYLRTNARGAELLGASHEAVLKSAIENFTSEQFHPLLPDLWGALERDGQLSGTYEVLRGNGTVGMIEFTAKRDLFDGQHLIVARNLPRSASPTVGFALVDPRDGEIYEVSPELCRLTGRPRARLLDAGLRVFGGARQRELTLHAIRSLADGSRGRYSFECKVERSGGSIQWLAISLQPVLGATTRVTRILLEAIPLVAPPTAADELLSAREREVLQLTADGNSASGVADVLVLSAGTVRTHLRNIYAKLGVSDRAAAVATGIRRGLIE